VIWVPRYWERTPLTRRKSWIKVRNPKSPEYMRISDGTF